MGSKPVRLRAGHYKLTIHGSQRVKECADERTI